MSTSFAALPAPETEAAPAPRAMRRPRGPSQARETPPLALRLGEAAEAISVSRATLWRLLQAGEIPVVRFGAIKRILRRDLEAWLEAHRE